MNGHGNILFVDDEFQMLAAIKRQLHKRAEVELASSGEDALRRLKSPGRYAAIVSDLRMPGVSGLELLTHAKTIAPDVVRVMLTGAVDRRTALAAVNEASVFRILVKPVDTPTLVKVLNEAIALHRRVVGDREMLEKMQAGAVSMLTELLDLTCPATAERALRLRAYARHIAESLALEHPEHFETLALMSQVGSLTLPAGLPDKQATGKPLSLAEQAMIDGAWEAGSRLAAHFPSLTVAATTLAAFYQPQHHLASANDVIGTGVRILRVVLAYDSLASTGLPTAEVLGRLEMDPLAYPAPMVDALRDLRPRVRGTSWVVEPGKLKPGMIFQQDVLARDGALLASRLQLATETLIQRIGARAATTDPIRVLVPDAM